MLRRRRLEKRKEVSSSIRSQSKKSTSNSSQSFKWLFVVCKILVTVVSAVIIFQIISTEKFVANLRQTNITWFWAAVILNVFIQAVSALRFSYVAQTLNAKLKYAYALRVHFIGLWFNQIFPTGLGGDVVKAALLSRGVGGGRAIRIAVLDRISGLVFLMFSILLLLIVYQRFLNNTSITFMLAMLSLGFFLTVIVLMATAVRVGSILHGKAIVAFFAVFSDLNRFRSGKALYQQIWTSAIIHFNGIATYFLLAKSLGMDPGVVIFALLVPLVFLVALVPVSFAGWGLRELGAVSIFGWVGISSEQALALSVLFGFLMIVVALPGLAIIHLPSVKPVAEQPRSTRHSP
jgi:glycosyltransferase 2 family protein